MAKLVEMVRNSPLMKRKAGGYHVLDTEAKDPFAVGIDFSAHYLASVEVKSKQDSPEVQQKVKEACTEAKKVKKANRKVLITVKSTTLQVLDVATKIYDEYPIFLVAYCGGHAEIADVFFFIYKTKIDRKLYAEIFSLHDAERVHAVTITVAKAFNIAYKAWMSEKRQRERANSKGSESPIPQRRHLGNGTKPSNLTKMAPGIVKPAGTYTPPPPRRPSEEQEASRPRRGSFGDNPNKNGPPKNPAVMRVISKNEKTGSTHNVVLTDDFDKEFQELAETRNRPDLLRTSLADDQTDHFNMDEIKIYIESQSDEENK